MAFSGAHWSPHFINKMHKRSNRMRKAPTPIERKLHKVLKEMGIAFTSQTVISTYIVDVCLVDYPLVIEADGFLYHSTTDQKERDSRRDSNLKKIGYQTLRLAGWNLSHPSLAKSMIREAISKMQGLQQAIPHSVSKNEERPHGSQFVRLLDTESAARPMSVNSKSSAHPQDRNPSIAA